MKVKIDFITNSSSTAMIVFIPEQYNLETERIVATEEYKDYLEDEEPTKKEIAKTIDEVIENMNYLHKGQEIQIGPYGYHALILFNILREDDLVLKEIEVDGEGGSTICPITLDELKSFVSKVKSKL